MEDFEKQARAFEELKATLEKSNANRTEQLSETKEKIAKIEKDLDAQEAVNQKLTAELSQKRITEEEMKKRVDDLERQLSRPSNGGEKTDVATTEMKSALNVFFRKKEEQKTAEDRALEMKYLRTDSDPLGGYLAPPQWLGELLKKIIEISDIRAYARVVQCNREALLVNIRNNILQGNWVGEGGTFPASTSNYAQKEIKLNKLAVSSIATTEMISDAMYDIDAQIMMDMAESFAQSEGDAFINGSGVARPEGLLSTVGQTNGVESYSSGIADSFDFDSIIGIAGQLKTGYKPYYVLNRKTLAIVRKLKDGLGQYLWTPGGAGGYPNQINGYPYISAINMPDVAADAYPILFGDLYRGYTIADNVNMSLIRDIYTLSTVGKVAFNGIRRVGGLVVMAEALKALKCAV